MLISIVKLSPAMTIRAKGSVTKDGHDNEKCARRPYHWLKNLRCIGEIAEPMEKTPRMEDHYVIPS